MPLSDTEHPTRTIPQILAAQEKSARELAALSDEKAQALAEKHRKAAEQIRGAMANHDAEFRARHAPRTSSRL